MSQWLCLNNQKDANKMHYLNYKKSKTLYTAFYAGSHFQLLDKFMRSKVAVCSIFKIDFNIWNHAIRLTGFENIRRVFFFPPVLNGSLLALLLSLKLGNLKFIWSLFDESYHSSILSLSLARSFRVAVHSKTVCYHFIHSQIFSLF